MPNWNILNQRSTEDIFHKIQQIAAVRGSKTNIPLREAISAAFDGFVGHTDTFTLSKHTEDQQLWGGFRLRPYQADNDVTLIEHIGANPNPPLGRLNYAGVPMLYLSLAPQTCFYECDAKAGDQFWVGHFEHLDHHPLKEVRFKMVGLVDELPGLIRHTTPEKRKLPPELQFSSQGRLNNEIIHSYICKMLTCHQAQDAEIYKLTNLIGEYFLNDPSYVGSPKQIRALLYPSVKRGAKHLNIAMSPEVAARHCSATAVYLVKVDSISEDGISYKILRKSQRVLNDGAIVW